MLKKQQRLTRSEFDTIFKSGKRYHSPFFTLIHQPDEIFHGAVVVGKKVFKSAVKRNTLRRRVYSILYQFMKTKKINGTFIIIAKPATANLPRKEISVEIASLISRIK